MRGNIVRLVSPNTVIPGSTPGSLVVVDMGWECQPQSQYPNFFFHQPLPTIPLDRCPLRGEVKPGQALGQMMGVGAAADRSAVTRRIRAFIVAAPPRPLSLSTTASRAAPRRAVSQVRRAARINSKLAPFCLAAHAQ